jgi:hypothetical protein
MMLRWMNYNGKINQVEWQMSTLTVSDYSVEHDIDTKAYNEWKDNFYMKKDGPYDNSES